MAYAIYKKINNTQQLEWLQVCSYESTMMQSATAHKSNDAASDDISHSEAVPNERTRHDISQHKYYDEIPAFNLNATQLQKAETWLIDINSQ